jgi:hypothetical protein
MFEHFCHAKIFRWCRTFFLACFQLGNEIANTQKIAGWYKSYIRGFGNKKERDSHKEQLWQENDESCRRFLFLVP